ncbi:MAG: alpha-amylase family glycosyl hydrolase [Bacteroidota bacterium]|jgi:glycosidase|nr:alpha-amylase family glycosyl hydrolase [Bacteroidota bacterium]
MHRHSASVRTLLLLLFAMLTLVSCRIRREENPDRPSLNLDGTWQFRPDPRGIGEKEKWFLKSDNRKWDTLTVPGSWDQRRDLASYDGAGWYRRVFDADIDTAMSQALIFDAVDDNATVWLNGTKLGEHRGYGQRFWFDVTGVLRDTDNHLVVRVEDIAGPGGLIGSVELRAFVEEEELLRGKYFDMKPVESADWVRDAVIYEVYLRSFSEEGTFRALEQRLPELRDMGVTVLWLMPIHPVGKVNRKGSLGSPYAVQDYYGINPEFGTLDDFKSLVAEAHVQGMHIIIDLVANHTAWDNPMITEHPEWYTMDADSTIVSPNADWHDVADLDYDAPGLRAYMKDMMLYWVRDIGIDGYRCDVAEMVPHDFWVDAIAALREIKPVMMLAEGAEPSLHIDAFDLTYAWNTYDILRPLVRGTLPVAEFAEVLTRERFRYPRHALRLRFTTNHDKNAYDAPAVEWLGPEAARAAAVLLHTIPGVPLIYNGQEVGTRVRMSLFEKEDIDWNSDSLDFRKLYTALNALRAAHEPLRRGDFHPVAVNDAPSVMAFVRTIDESHPVFVAVNLSAKTASFTCPVPDGLQGHNLLSSGTVTRERRLLRISIPAWGHVILR